VCLAAWIGLALLLRRTSVPSLDLDGLDVRRYFSEHELRRSHRYANGEYALWLGQTAAMLAALVVLVRRLPRSARGIGLGRIGTSIVLGMVILATLWLVGLPFRIAALWWQHHWGLGPFDLAVSLREQQAGLAPMAALATAAIAALVALAARFRRWWWAVAGAALVVLAALLAFLSGWLAVADTSPLRHPALLADVARLERVEGVDAPVRVQKVGDETRQANAFAVGIGPSKHVVLWNTLLDGRFGRGEVRVVVAHELGHLKRHHVPKALGWLALIVFPGLLLVALVTGRRGGLAEPANLPLAALAVAVFSLLSAPLQNAASRRYEAEADWIAIRATDDPAAATRLFQRFERTSLQEPDPPTVAYLWLASHPTLMQRIAMAERFAERRRAR